MMLLPYTIIDFHLFYDWAYKNMSPSDKKSV